MLIRKKYCIVNCRKSLSSSPQPNPQRQLPPRRCVRSLLHLAQLCTDVGVTEVVAAVSLELSTVLDALLQTVFGGGVQHLLLDGDILGAPHHKNDFRGTSVASFVGVVVHNVATIVFWQVPDNLLKMLLLSTFLLTAVVSVFVGDNFFQIITNSEHSKPLLLLSSTIHFHLVEQGLASIVHFYTGRHVEKFQREVEPHRRTK